MPIDLDDMLAKAGDAPPGRTLDGLEAQVWSRIDTAQRHAATAALWGWRSAAAGLLLVLGILAGGEAFARRDQEEAALFSPQAAFAPSTLLGEAR